MRKSVVILIIAVLAFGLSIAGAYIYKDIVTSDNYVDPRNYMPEEDLKLEEDIKKSKTQYDDLTDSIVNYKDELDNYYDRVYELREELERYVDEEGNIKEGYESNVRYIVKELKDSYGIEIDIIGTKVIVLS